MKDLFTVSACAGLILVSAVTAPAAPLTYSEAVSGDLVGLGSQPVLLFDVGVNTISGSAFTSLASTDADAFDFSIPLGTQLTSATFSSTLTLLTGTPWGIGPGFELYQGLSFANHISTFQNERESVLPNPGFAAYLTDGLLWGPSLPLGPGLYRVGPDAWSGGDNNSYASWDYTLSFTVESTEVEAPVPEPATLLLFSAGLAGVAGRRWRRQRR